MRPLDHGGYVKVWNALVLEWGGALAPYSRLGGTFTRCIYKGSRRWNHPCRLAGAYPYRTTR